MKILIKVTQEILNRSAWCGLADGQTDVGTNCAFALALREIFPECSVMKWHMHVYTKDQRIIQIAHTPEMVGYIDLFDHATPVQRVLLPPKSFEFTVPNELIDEIGIGEAFKILSESRTLELVSI